MLQITSNLQTIKKSPIHCALKWARSEIASKRVQRIMEITSTQTFLKPTIQYQKSKSKIIGNTAVWYRNQVKTKQNYSKVLKHEKPKKKLTSQWFSSYLTLICFQLILLLLKNNEWLKTHQNQLRSSLYPQTEASPAYCFNVGVVHPPNLLLA